MARAGEKLIEIDGVRHKPLNEVDFRLIIALAENNMRVTETAYAIKLNVLPGLIRSISMTFTSLWQWQKRR